MRPRLFVAAVFAFALLCLSNALADDYHAPDVASVLVLEKIRHAAGEFQSGAYRITTQSEGHGITQTRTTLRHGDDYKTSITMASGFTDAWGSFAGKDWSMDENGVVFSQNQSGELQSATERIDDEKYTKVLGISAQTGCLDIDVNPPHGEHTVRCYDPQTYLLRQITVWRRDLHKHVTAYSDYRVEYGEQIPFTRRSGDGRSENDIVDQVVSVEKLTAVPDLAPPMSKPMFMLVGAPLTLPAKFASDGHILVRVNVGTRGLDFTLDTGAGAIVLDPGVAHDLGIEAIGHFGSTIGGDYQSSLARVPEMHIGGISMHDVAVRLAPLSYNSDAGKEVGLLGRDFLASGIVEIDYKNRQVKLWPRDTFAAASKNLDPIVADFSGDSPSVQASFDGVKGKFLFDTGAAFSMVYRAYMESLPTHVPNGAQMTGIFVGGPVEMHGYRLSNLSLGPAIFRQVDTWVPMSSTAELGSYDGIIGRDVLGSFRIFLDYQSAKLYLLNN